MWITFDFECSACDHVFSDMVKRKDPHPDECPNCAATCDFKKLPCAPAVPKKIILDYPGSKRLKAGYAHTHADRPAEKKGSQVSMAGSGGLAKG